MNIYERLNLARADFHALSLKKSGHNKFAGYHYFELADFIEPALEILAKHGLFAVISYDAELASLTVIDTKDPDQRLTISSPMGSAALKGCHDVQNRGAVMTYQRRYLWVTLLEIVENDAVDSAEPTQPQAPKKAPF